MNVKPPSWVKHVSEIALLSVRKSVPYWAALLLLAYGLAIVTTWSVSAFVPMKALAGANLPQSCPSSIVCSSPPVSLADCGNSPHPNPANEAAFWWACPRQKLVVFSVRSKTDTGMPSAHWVFESDPRAGGGLFVFPLLVDERGVSRYGKRIDLITFYSRNMLNPATPTIAAPYPVEFLKSEVKRVIDDGEHVILNDEEQASKAIGIFDAGIRELGLEDRSGFFARRAISGEIQQVTLILFWVFVLIAACRMWLGNYERTLLEKYKSDGTAENGQALLNRVLSDSGGGDRSRSDVLAWLCNCAALWLKKGVRQSNVPALIDLERESLGRTWDHEYAPFKFILWAIPSIGFVGTVVGIGQSMMLTAGLASPDESARVGARGAISSSISVAFDTTLVALVAAILLMLVFLALQAKENGALEEARDFVVSRGLGGSSGSREPLHEGGI